MNALKKLEDDTAEQEGQNDSLSGIPGTKETVRKRIRKNIAYGGILRACFAITLGIIILTGLIRFIATRNPAGEANQTYPQSESLPVMHSGAKPADPESLKPVLEHKFPAYAEKKSEPSEKQEDTPVSGTVPVSPSLADTQENMAKFQDMAASQVKKEEENDPVSTGAEKSDDKAVSETVKPVPRAASTVPLLPEPKNPVKGEPVSLLPASKNPVKSEVSGFGPPKPAKTSAPPEQMKVSPPSESAKDPSPPEPVKLSALSETEDYASVGEKTAGETGLSIQALVWSADPAERMAVINGSIVRQKGMVADVSVIHIGSDHIIFQNDTARWMQKFRLN